MLRGGNNIETIAYFDNAATSFPKPEEVYTFMDTFYRECGVNVGRGQHKLASKASAMVAETRKLILKLNHCPSREVIFTPSATEALNIIIRSIIFNDDMNIYISPFEHNAVVRVLNHVKEKNSFNIIFLAVDKTTYMYDVEKIENQFSKDKPDIVIISHASNVCGVIAPITEICALSKTYGAINIIDMCQTMGLIDTNLNNNNVDYAVFAAHKTLYGPMGIGGFIMKRGNRPEPLIFGGTGVDSSNPLLPDSVPERYEAGSQNILSIAGLNASLKWINKTDINTIYRKEATNYEKLINILSQYNNIKILSPKKEIDTIGVVSTLFKGYSSDNIGQILSAHNVAVRSGLHCAPNAHKFLDTFPSGTVRFSVSYFTNDNDFELLKLALNYINENS